MSLVNSRGSKIDKSYAKMYIRGDIEYTTESTKVESWCDSSINISKGKFICEPNNSRIKISVGAANTIKFNGLIAGLGAFFAKIDIIDSQGKSVLGDTHQSFGILSQPGGNKYGKVAFPSTILEIDSTKEHFVILMLSGYNENFILNRGFGEIASFISIEKID